jgi:hypothetical protein
MLSFLVLMVSGVWASTKGAGYREHRFKMRIFALASREPLQEEILRCWAVRVEAKEVNITKGAVNARRTTGKSPDRIQVCICY